MPNDDAEYKKKIKLLEDKIVELEKQNKNLNNTKEDVRSKSKQIEMLEKRNRDLEEAKRKLGRDILDQNRNNENEAKKIQDLKNEIHLLRSKGKGSHLTFRHFLIPSVVCGLAVAVTQNQCFTFC